MSILFHNYLQILICRGAIANESLPPGGRGTACGGRSLRGDEAKFVSLQRVLPQSPNGASSLPEGAYSAVRLTHKLQFI